MDCLICQAKTNRKNTICSNCLDLFELAGKGPSLRIDGIDQVHSLYNYQGLLRKTVLAYKFANKRYLAKLFAELLADYIVENGLHRKIDLIVPVPLHRTVLRERGFNQVELLADIIGKDLNIEVSKKALVKIKHTKEQAKLGRQDRIKNLNQAFKLKDKGIIKAKDILILDDIMTTGSTFSHCSQALRRGEYSSLIALALARG